MSGRANHAEGVELARRCLQQQGFTILKPQGGARGYAEIWAERSEGGRTVRYGIRVKVRHMVMQDGGLNNRYKLGEKGQIEAAAAVCALVFTAAWIAVEFDKETANVYFGLFDALNGAKAISMSEVDRRNYECLGRDVIR